MLHVPKYTAGATLSYSFPSTAVTLGMTNVSSWTEVDWLALYGVYFARQPYRGSQRAYWMTYPSFVKFNLSVSQTVSDRFTVFLRSDNLTNENVAEIYNLNTNSGRLTMIGVRTKL